MIEIIPRKSAGPFILDSRIADYLDKYPPDEVGKYDPITDDVCYRFFGGDLCVYVDDGIIYSVAIYFDCYLYDRNIFMMSIDDFLHGFDILDKERTVADRLWVRDDEQQDVYEIESLGLTLWVNDFRKIVTISVYK